MTDQDVTNKPSPWRVIQNWFSAAFNQSGVDSADISTAGSAIKNSALTAYKELPTSTIFHISDEQVLTTKEIRIPVNPDEDAKWPQIKSKTPLLSGVEDQHAQKVLESALCLVYQAVEYDRYQQRLQGELGVRSEALQPFLERGAIKHFAVTTDPQNALYFDEESATLFMGEGHLKDFFRTVGALLLGGAEAHEKSLDAVGEPSPTDALRCAKQAYGFAACHLEEVKRYLESLESGNPEDKRLWGVAIEREIAALRFNAGIHQCAIPLFEVMEEVARRFCADHQLRKASAEDLDKYTEVFRELHRIVSQLDLRIQFVDVFTRNTDGTPGDSLGFGVSYIAGDSGVEIGPDIPGSLQPSSIDIRFPEGREELLRFIQTHKAIWNLMQVDPEMLSKNLRESLERMTDLSTRIVRAEQEYSKLFSAD